MLLNFIYEHNLIYWMYTTPMYFQIFVCIVSRVTRGKRNSILFEVVLEFALLTLIRTSQVD